MKRPHKLKNFNQTQLKLVLPMVRHRTLWSFSAVSLLRSPGVSCYRRHRDASVCTTWQLKKLRLENTLPREKQTLTHTRHWNLSQTVVVLPHKTITVISVHLEQRAQQYGSCLLSRGSCTWQRPQSAIKGNIEMCNDLLCPSPVLWHPSFSCPVLLSDAVLWPVVYPCCPVLPCLVSSCPVRCLYAECGINLAWSLTPVWLHLQGWCTVCITNVLLKWTWYKNLVIRRWICTHFRWEDCK